MFKWLNKKFWQSELDNDLKGLNSLSGDIRVRTALLIYQQIQNGFNMLAQDAPLRQVQEALQGLRREAVKKASGYQDPTHLVASLPETFFLTFSEAYPSDSVQVRRSISSALKTIIEQDTAQFFPVEEAKGIKEEFETFWFRLADNNLI